MVKRKNIIYGNCKVFSPQDELMFLCLEKKAKWYLDRGLAIIVKEDPLEIKLTFQPNGKGHTFNSAYYLAKKENKCVVCGETDIKELTKHHVVPSEYVKHFPLEVKSRSSHDIVAICQKCHYDYENNHAQKLKMMLLI